MISIPLEPSDVLRKLIFSESHYDKNIDNWNTSRDHVGRE